MANCSVDGCEKSVCARGLCRGHYMRQRQYGSPTATKLRIGEIQKFYEEVVLPYQGDDCLIWPYTRSIPGYGQMAFKGRRHNVSRLACMHHHGPPPTDTHQAAHNCGGGRNGCVNPKHVEWKTPSENMADKVIHGTDNRGEKNYRSKLTKELVLEIVRLKDVDIKLRGGQKAIAKRYGIDQSTVSDLWTGRRWAWLERDAA